jgi:hypothetical protein
MATIIFKKLTKILKLKLIFFCLAKGPKVNFAAVSQVKNYGKI